MRHSLRRKYRTPRNQFKNDLYARCENNRALAMLIVQTYTAWHHRRHITKIWGMFRNPDYEAFRKDYSENLMGKHLSGRDDIWRSLYFAEKDLCDKYKYLIPETLAMGDALSVAYSVLEKK